MHSHLRVAPLVLLAILPLFMGFNKKPKITITFHAQAEATDPRKTSFDMQIEGQIIVFKVVPEVSQQNIVAFHPFDSETGDKGMALQLDFSGRENLELITRMRHGQVLVAMINGVPVDYVVIDRVIDNGLVTIWRGVTDENVKELDKKYTRIQPGTTPSASKGLDMLPSTKKEKKSFWSRRKKEDKEAEKAAKEGTPPPVPTIPSLDAPRAPTTNRIPVEGGAPGAGAGNPATPGNPALPPSVTPVTEPALPR
jgi:hypothetical protein